MVETLGLIAGIFVLISFAMTGERKIRMFNIVGCGLFVVYGFFIGALSVWLVNVLIIGVHIYFLLRKPHNTEENPH